MFHPISQQQVAALRGGRQLNITSGLGTVTVLAVGRLNSARDGHYASRNAILLLDPDQFVSLFSVHRVIYQDDQPIPATEGTDRPILGTWVAEDGTYPRTLAGALGAFAEREDTG